MGLPGLALGPDWQAVLMPVYLDERVSALFLVAYQRQEPMAAEKRQVIRNFADRIAVALSNAAWEEKLFHKAHFDALTGLPNRLVLQDRLQQDIVRAQRDGSQIAVLFIDLDRFKNVNDSMGHSAGDELLTHVARVFTDCVRSTDLVVRLGGDEFVIVITDIHQNENPVNFVSGMAQKIMHALERSTTLVSGLSMTPSASIGIALFPEDAGTFQDLLKNADAALYHAKNEGRAVFRFYSPELNATALDNMRLEQDLRSAIQNNELRVYYQPKVDLQRRVVGTEALIRWQHPERGLVSPAAFIPLAEQSGLIIDIGEWVLEQSCAFVALLKAMGFKPIRISVNLSALEFKRNDLIEKIEAILNRTQVDPHCIELELTESIAILNFKTCVDRMQHLKRLGLTLSMDDFGTGFSSLSYLQELPLDVLKIDQSFVRLLAQSRSSQAIAKTIIALADGLNMKTVAEGVETQEQADLLEQFHCHIFQGYLFSRPIPAQDFVTFLKDAEAAATAG